jgi:hypothetical protein
VAADGGGSVEAVIGGWVGSSSLEGVIKDAIAVRKKTELQVYFTRKGFF